VTYWRKRGDDGHINELALSERSITRQGRKEKERRKEEKTTYATKIIINSVHERERDEQVVLISYTVIHVPQSTIM
jgi:hypothetical protein